MYNVLSESVSEKHKIYKIKLPVPKKKYLIYVYVLSNIHFRINDKWALIISLFISLKTGLIIKRVES